MDTLADSVLLVGILGGLTITILGALAMLSIGLSRRLQREITYHQQALSQLEAANQLLQQQLAEISELQQRLKEQAIRDALTGLLNRRYLDETLPRELARAKRDGYPLAIIMIDIDHFKQINDTYGHAGGDEVIRALSSILHDGARESDITCRYGGEEFVVALPHMDITAAKARAEKWRQAAAAQCVQHGELAIRFTLSAGISAFPIHAGEVDVLLEHADQALYRSKHDGRNRVTCHDPASLPEPMPAT